MTGVCEVQLRDLTSCGRLLRPDRPVGQARITQLIRLLCEDPFRSGTKKLKGFPYRSARVGDWRILYEVEAGRLLISIIEIGPRGQVYRRLR